MSDCITSSTSSKGKKVSLKMLTASERETVGGFSEPGKMPWLSWSIPAEHCQIGSKLAEVEGSVCHGCYALKGNYLYPSTRNAMARRFSRLDEMEQWALDMIRAIRERASRYVPTEDEPLPSFRWHDSGDIQSPEHFSAICYIAEQTQECVLADGSTGDVEHWIPSREYGHITSAIKGGTDIPRNLCVRLSAHMIDGPVPTKYGLPVSSVHTDESNYPNAEICPAYTQGGKCLTCRTCWDKTVKHVSYPKH